MDKIEVAALLLSFVWALALTRILESLRDLWIARARVTPSASQFLWMAAILLSVALSWLNLALLGDYVRGWVVLGLFAYGMGLYFAAAAASPAPDGQEPLDLAEYETREGAAYKLTNVALMVLALPLDYELALANGPAPGMPSFLLSQWSVFATLAVYAVGLSGRRWVRTSCATGAVLLAVYALVRNLALVT